MSALQSKTVKAETLQIEDAIFKEINLYRKALQIIKDCKHCNDRFLAIAGVSSVETSSTK